MLTRIQPGAVRDLARRDLPEPVDVINLISTANFNSYRWYGLLVMPALLAAGGKVLWMSRFERSVRGEQQADKLLIVRYPSHRRFLAMTLNPYYLAINLLRESGVRRFEASFTHASHSDPELARKRLLLGVHFESPGGEDALGAVSQSVRELGGELAYATKAVASLGILDPPVETDPHPLAFGELALYEFPGAELSDSELAALADAIEAVAARSSLHLYRREHRSAYRPSLWPTAQPETAVVG